MKSPQNQQKKRWIDWVVLLVYVSILIGALLLLYYFIITEVNSCTKDPFEYGVQQVKDKIDVDYVYGTLVASKGTTTFKEGFGDVYNTSEGNITKLISS